MNSLPNFTRNNDTRIRRETASGPLGSGLKWEGIAKVSPCIVASTVSNVPGSDGGGVEPLGFHCCWAVPLPPQPKVVDRSFLIIISTTSLGSSDASNHASIYLLRVTLPRSPRQGNCGS